MKRTLSNQFSNQLIFKSTITTLSSEYIGDQSWIVGNLIFSVVAFGPAALWAHRKLSPKNAETKWMNSLLRGNGSQVTSAMAFINEIEEFEKEDDL